MEDSRRESLESALLTHPAVADCVAAERVLQPSGVRVMAAYVSLTTRARAEDLQRFARQALPSFPADIQVVPVTALPLRPDGTVDAERIARWSVADDALAAAWEQAVGAAPHVDAVAAVVDERPARIAPLHLSDSLPTWMAPQATAVAPTPAVDGPNGKGLPDALSVATGEPLSPAAGDPQPLTAWLARAAEDDATLVCVEVDGVERENTCRTLLASGRRIAAGLRRRGVIAGDRVLLQCDRVQDFLDGFWGCVFAGAVPVPLAVPPRYDIQSQALDTLHAAWDVLDRPFILTRHELCDDIRRATVRLSPAPRVIDLEPLRSESSSIEHTAAPGDLALLMLTSGSTGTPKAVMLTHENLWHRTAGSCQMNGFSTRDISLNWMPLDHVAGLIYFHLRDTFVRCRQVHVATSYVLQDPVRWIDLLERYRATVTFAPNFAFALVNDRTADLTARVRDLSSVRLILNGAEAIVARTARRFLTLLAPHGLRGSAMHPAWGMSETSSGVTYSDRFSPETTSDDDQFVEVGRPVPGLSLRIVLEAGNVAPEGTVGRLQVRGPMVTAGYYRNPAMTRDAFTEDGWFVTGDLGIICGGRLTITGREKDVVIVNSVNYHCHSLEGIVEELAGVEPTYTAACAIRQPGTDTDRLAVFFHPRVDHDGELGRLLAEIRSELTRRVGIAPDVLVPVEKHQIPKTSLGKIQRAELSRRLQAGEFDDAVRRSDIASGNVRTIPNWFYIKRWRRRASDTRATTELPRSVLLLVDPAGPAGSVQRSLEAAGVECVIVPPGAEYVRVIAQLHTERRLPRLVLHLWSYRTPVDAPSEEGLDRAHTLGAATIIQLVKALADTHTEPAQLFVVANSTHGVEPSDAIDPETAPLVGLLQSISQELPWLDCRHLDVVDPGFIGEAMIREIQSGARERVVAYRRGLRYVPGLVHATPARVTESSLPFARQGMYLVTGGAGGIAEHVAAMLRERFDAHLLLVGRRPGNAQTDTLVRRLQTSNGGAGYERVDVCDEARLEEVVAEYERRWNRRLSGILHFAGVYHECPIVEEETGRFLDLLRPKTTGTIVLHRLLARRGGGLFVASSSVMGLFGGATTGAYAAANAFQHAFAEQHDGRDGVRHVCLAWSSWDDVGQRRDWHLSDAARARGYLAISPERGVQSLLIGIAAQAPVVLVGIDGVQPAMRRLVEHDASPLRQLTVFYSGAANVPFPSLDRPRDRFGVPAEAELVRVAVMPRNPDGAIARERLVKDGASRTPAHREPESAVERELAHLWKSMLSIPSLSADDSFFSLGGDSLQAVRMLGRIREIFGVELSIRTIFDADDLGALASVIESAQQGSAGTPDAGSHATAHADTTLLDHLEDLSEAEIDALLQQLEGQQR